MGTALIAALLALGGTGDAAAQRFGLQASYADDTDFGAGARIEIPFALSDAGVLSRAFGVGSFDWYFPDCENFVGLGDTEIDCSYWEINANIAVPFTVAASVTPYAGAGVNVARVSVSAENEIGDFDDSETEIGANLLGGLRFPLGGLAMYTEARAELGGAKQFVITVGLLLGGNE
jgi:opacity protein-like surface antigen